MVLTNPTGISGQRLRGMAFAALAIVLSWEVLSRSLVAYLAEVAPQVALALRSGDPRALVNASEYKLNVERPDDEAMPSVGSDAATEESGRLSAFARYAGGAAQNGRDETAGQDQAKSDDSGELMPSAAADPKTREEVRSQVREALAHDPLSAHALRLLGQVADAADEDEAAQQLMQAAAQRSQRESVAVFWLMRKAFQRKDYPATIRYADILLRTRPQIVAQVIPTLARIAENKDASGYLKEALGANPPWRGLFFANLLQNITDARTPLDLLLSIKDTPTPPTVKDLRDYLNLLIKYNFHELAYYVWLQFLPRDQLTRAGLLFNGSFEAKPSGLPFDWVILPGSGVTIEFARKPNEPGQHALLVEFGLGRVDFRGVSQIVMLAPGTYQLKGQYTGQVIGRRGLEWRILCTGGTAGSAEAATAAAGAAPAGPLPLAKSPMVVGSTPDWTDFSVNFTVPETDCRAQQVRLWFDARSASEQLVSGAVWYDRLQIARVE
jgi:hypothetical protein